MTHTLKFALIIPAQMPKEQEVLDGDKCPLRFGVLRFPGNRWFKDLLSKCGNWDMFRVVFLLPFSLFFFFFALISCICWVSNKDFYSSH